MTLNVMVLESEHGAADGGARASCATRATPC